MRLYMPSYSPLKLGLGLTVLVVALWWVMPPQSLQIVDEKAYFEQAYALAHGRIYTEFDLAANRTGYEPKHYPLGTALWMAPGIKLFGRIGAFLTVLLAWLGAAFILYRVIDQRYQTGIAVFALLAFPPAIIMSRHLMSELPGMFFIALWVAGLIQMEKSPSARLAFSMGLLSWLGLCFRETNLLLTLPWFIVYGWQRQPHWPWLLPGGMLGLGVRLFTSHWAYGSPFYLKDPGVAFSLAYLPSNLPVYLIGLLLFLPAGLWVVWQYRGGYAWRPLYIGMVLYVSAYLCYGYSGNHDGFVKSLALGLRYLIPTLPLFVLFYARYMQKYPFFTSSKSSLSISLATALLITTGYYIDHQYDKKQLNLRQTLVNAGYDVCARPEWDEHCSHFYLLHQ